MFRKKLGLQFVRRRRHAMCCAIRRMRSTFLGGLCVASSKSIKLSNHRVAETDNFRWSLIGHSTGPGASTRSCWCYLLQCTWVPKSDRCLEYPPARGRDRQESCISRRDRQDGQSSLLLIQLVHGSRGQPQFGFLCNQTTRITCAVSWSVVKSPR